MVSNKIYLLLDLNRLPKCSIIPHPPMKMTPHFCIMYFGLSVHALMDSNIASQLSILLGPIVW